MEVLLCKRVNDLRYSLFHLLNCLITTASELRESAKAPGRKVRTRGRVPTCLDTLIGPRACETDDFVPGSIVLLGKPLRFGRAHL